MISDTTYDIISGIGRQYVPDRVHEQLHVNCVDAWIDMVVDLVNKGLIKPKMGAILKCAYSWETLLTIKLSRLN